MAPYEALYGRPCRSQLCWTEVGESSITGPDLIRETSVRLVLVLWRHYGVEESTWEREDTMRATYPFLFRDEGTWVSRLRFK